MKKSKHIISEKDISHLAELARIELSRKDVTSIHLQLNEILDYFTLINEVNTKDVSPTYHIFDQINIFREDEPNLPEPEKLLANATNKKDRFIKAPKMV